MQISILASDWGQR